MKIVTDFSVTSAAPRARYGWYPGWLLRSGEDGAWYDPADSSTVFEDSGGKTPATVGQPVGLMLDKSRALARGPNIGIPANHTLSGGAGYADYDTGTGVYSISRDASGSGQVFFYGVDPDLWYEIDLEVLDGGGGAALAIRDGSTVLASVGPSQDRTTRILRFTSGAIRMDLTSFPLSTQFAIYGVRSLAGRHMAVASTDVV